jgi:hypothetical protein
MKGAKMKILRIGFVDSSGRPTGGMLPQVYHDPKTAERARRKVHPAEGYKAVILDLTNNLQIPFCEDLYFGQKELF